ncbi:hypothetical protein ACFVIM_23310 [Streptomyces sp. NPDC057638]|uniref:hypothetical protein n=1 Tax=Streptomyces sp. NPDC057638 TaxID=3346190 RepID=UPI0036B53999
MPVPACQTCHDLITAERDAESVHDYSRATDCRVLLRRHHTHGHQTPPDQNP